MRLEGVELRFLVGRELDFPWKVGTAFWKLELGELL